MNSDDENSLDKNSKYMHVQTPLVQSHELTLANSTQDRRTNVYLKLDNCQPSGSFKLRGVGYLVLKSFLSGKIKPISSSGGNAGLAAAYVAYKLKIKATIVTPKTILPSVVDKLKSYDANVLIHGNAWDEANEEALKLCRSDESAVYISPFDDRLIWEGNSTIIDEIKEQISGKVPDCIIASVGGGGLLIGLIEGLVRNDWIDKVKVIAVETIGTDSFAQSVRQNKLVTLNEISSIAKSLGAKTCSSRLFDLYLKHKDRIESVVVSDRDVVETMSKFLDDHRILAEPACAAAITVAYNLKKYLSENYENVVVEVCGGSSITLKDLDNYKKQFDIRR